jgi:hypothetical protein
MAKTTATTGSERVQGYRFMVMAHAVRLSRVDDAHVLAFGKSTEETCSVLKDIQCCCLTWGDMHGTSFAPHKYVNFHFPKKKRN